MQFQPNAGQALVCESVCVFVRVCMRASMYVSPLHFVSIVQVGNKRFREFEKKGDGRTDGRTDLLKEMRGRI